ncbi:unnamed protein product [Trifolium pratense]|uniref:Uncharacterized protein n=1 Tax=Trifolium pratense TaxID=57577 RepID=A0ACB0KBB3_TRIPR|nr:unnamed protein product [Trifolium pratense]
MFAATYTYCILKSAGAKPSFKRFVVDNKSRQSDATSSPKLKQNNEMVPSAEQYKEQSAQSRMRVLKKFPTTLHDTFF